MSVFDAAQALLALATECLDAACEEYARIGVDTSVPVADCSNITAVIGNMRAQSGSCVGRAQLNTNLDLYVTRCCEPVGELTTQQGYTPPSPDAVSAAVQCLARDIDALYQCIVCDACDTLGAVPGVVACCNREVGAPEIIWPSPSGGCRTGIIRVPIVLLVCCPTEPA